MAGPVPASHSRSHVTFLLIKTVSEVADWDFLLVVTVERISLRLMRNSFCVGGKYSSMYDEVCPHLIVSN